jgi:uncharacterized protein YecE (DUF72 family)
MPQQVAASEPDNTSMGVRIGISGWRYAPWRGTFDPSGLKQTRELEFAASRFPIIEINGTFYSLQEPARFTAWRRATPEGFVFSVKGPRFITHMRRLKDVRVPLANFLASGLLRLEEKLGPLLWQFPPNFRFDPDRMAAFFDLLPVDTSGAARLARSRDARMRGRTSLAVDKCRPLRHAVEIRHESFVDPAFIEMLRERGIGLVIAETARHWPMLGDVTADFVYLRLHGDTELYRSGYSDQALERWARRIRAWRRGSLPADVPRAGKRSGRSTGPRDVYCFFDNTDVKLRAPFDALSLMGKLGVKWGETPGPV